MNRLSKSALPAGLILLGATVALAGDGDAPPPPIDDPAAARAEIERMRPAEHAWRAVRWINCPREALARARAENKPVITWVFLGNPADERC